MMTPREVAEAVVSILIEECEFPEDKQDQCIQQYLESGTYSFKGAYDFDGLLTYDDDGIPWLTFAPESWGGDDINKMVLRTNHRLHAYSPTLLRLYNPAAVILNVGCGWLRFLKTLRAGQEITMDINSLVKPDIVHDLNQYPWPVQNESVDLIVAVDILEHLEDVVKMVEESWRILQPGGTLIIRTVTANEQGFTDPTHRHWFSLNSFDYFDPTTEIGALYGFYSNYKFKITTKGVSGEDLVYHLQKQSYVKSGPPSKVKEPPPHTLIPLSGQHQ